MTEGMCHNLLRYAFIVDLVLIFHICCLVMHLLLSSLTGCRRFCELLVSHVVLFVLTFVSDTVPTEVYILTQKVGSLHAMSLDNDMEHNNNHCSCVRVDQRWWAIGAW